MVPTSILRHVSGLLMMAAIRGKERTLKQWQELYGAAGFGITSMTPLDDNFGTSIVEGTKGMILAAAVLFFTNYDRNRSGAHWWCRLEQLIALEMLVLYSDAFPTDVVRVFGQGADMKNKFGVLIVWIMLILLAGSACAGEVPYWAYGFTGPANPTPSANAPAATATPDPTARHIAGSKFEFTRAQISDRFGPADWYPEDHPIMPEVVAHGKKPGVWACALCHYPNGKGRPENAGVAGLPVAYFMQTMDDFRSGNRKSTESRKSNTNIMIAIAKGMTDDEIKQSAEYFGSMKWTPWMRVVETASVPRTRTSVGMFLTLEGSEKEPLGQRIIETPENVEATEVLRDDHSAFIVYAPIGSVKKGETLVTTGSGRTTRCDVCHGPDLKGLGPVPSLAGRSPSYLVRQMYDMQQGTRKGIWSELMRPVVNKLTDQDMIAIAAYLASREP